MNTRPPFQNHPLGTQAFSLVETLLAMAVLAVVLVGLIGMIPSGTQTFQRAMDTSLSAQIAQRLLQDAQESEFDALIDKGSLPADPEGKSSCPQYFTFRAPKVNAPGWRYYDAQGNEIVPKGEKGISNAELQAAVYHVTMRIMPRAVLPSLNESGSQVAQLTVQVARNPGNLPLEFCAGGASDPDAPERNLLRPGKVPIFTYAALVGKNHGR